MIAEHDPDLIPDLSKAEIQDKSKADSPAKTIVCMQALWAQIVGRFATQNPISLLEMNTFLHALFCFAIYAAWWYKPLDVEESSLIDLSSEALKGFAAWMVMDSTLGQQRERYRNDTPSQAIVPGPNLWLEYNDDAWATSGGSSAIQVDLVDRATAHYQKVGRPIDMNPTNFTLQQALNSDTLTLYYGQTCYGFRLVGSDISGELLPYKYHARLEQSHVECLRLAQHFRRLYVATWDKTLRFGVHPSTNWVVTQASVNYSSDEFVKGLRCELLFSLLGVDSTLVAFCVALTAAGSVYGGLHLLAWNGPFPTRAEKILWRTSGFLIAVPFPVAILSLLLFRFVMLLRSRRQWHKWFSSPLLTRLANITTRLRERIIALIKRTCKQYLLRYLRDMATPIEDTFGSMMKYPTWAGIASPGIALVVVFCLLYLAARVYLIVECFVKLAHLPSEVYRELEWSNMIPHFGSG